MPRSFVRWLVPAAIVAFVANPARAQQSLDHHAVHLNPLGLILGFLSAEYERRLTPSASGAIFLGVYDADDRLSEFDNVSQRVVLEGKYRFYPSERAPGGFSVGLAAGYSRVRVGRCRDGTCDDVDADALSTGVEIAHTWLLGAERRFAARVGGGAKRLYYLTSDLGDPNRVFPTGAFTIGWRF